jgi:serine/threonine-protein kinase
MAVMNLDRIGKYRVVDRIGHGAMGEVFKAHDPFLNRYVALKTISPALAGDPEFRQRFQREAQSAAQLSHPNIVTIYDFGNDDAGLTYMAMELLEGVDLREAIRRRSLGTLLQRLDVMEQICDGLAFAHGRGVVHRDLKPGNIHLQPTGQVKILDFGLARLTSSEMTKTGTVMGTPHYMSPEQVRGQKADARSDVFSLGAVFYELLANQRPFDGRTVSEVLQSIVERDAPPLRSRAPGTPEALAGIVERALARDATQRFADAGEMGRALARAREALAGETLVAPPALEATIVQTPGETIVRPATAGSAALDPRRRSGVARRSELPGTVRPDPTVAADATELGPPPSRTLLVAGSALALAVVAGGGWLWLRSREPAAPTASATQEQSVITEALLSGKVELARADLGNRAYKDAAEHAREALAIDPTSAEAREVLDRAEQSLRDLEAAVTAARAALAKGDTGAASEALGRVLELDRRHPAARQLVSDLNRYSRRQAEDARGRAAASRAAAENASTTRTPAYAQARRLTADADGLFGQERFAEAAEKYIESRDAFDGVKREADAARAAEAARVAAAAARPAPTSVPSPTALPTMAAPAPTTAPIATPLPAPATPLPTAAVTGPGPATTAASVPSAPARDPQDTAVRRVITDYGRALESQDVDLFRTLKPDLTSEEEKRLRESFKAVKSQQVGIEIDSVEVSGGEAVVKVSRQDTLNGRAQRLQKQVFRLARTGSSWRIVSMGPLKE